MPSVNAYIVADWPKGGTTVFRLRIGEGTKGWITGITNKTLGPLWFPKYGKISYDIHNGADTLRVDSEFTPTSSPIGPAELQAVYGSPTPVFPVDIIAIVDYPGTSQGPDVNPDMFPSPTGQGGFTNPPPQEGVPPGQSWGDDVSSGAIPTLAYLEIGVEYWLVAPIEFNASIRLDRHDPFKDDGCGHRFQLVGAAMSFSPGVDSVRADGIIIRTTYRWQVTGAQVTGGVVDADTDSQPITLLLSRPGTVQVDLGVTITSQVTGTNVVTETGTRRSSYRFEVLSVQEAQLASAICKLLQDSLQIRRFVFPGDPARFRRTLDQQRQISFLGQRVGADAEAFVASLNQVLADSQLE